MTLEDLQKHVKSTKTCPTNADLAIAEIERNVRHCYNPDRLAALLDEIRDAVGGDSDSLQYCSNALCGEAGEFANQVKKAMRDDLGRITEDRRHKLVSELGDVLWYAAACCDELGITLDDVASALVVKTTNRLKRGKGL